MIKLQKLKGKTVALSVWEFLKKVGIISHFSNLTGIFVAFRSLPIINSRSKEDLCLRITLQVVVHEPQLVVVGCCVWFISVTL